MTKYKNKKQKYPSPEVYDHVRFKSKKVSLKDKNIWYLAIALVVLIVTFLIISTLWA
jgi:hypothetical protein